MFKGNVQGGRGKYPNEEFTSQEDWFQKHTWTPEEEKGFKEWMAEFLEERYPYWTRRMIKMEISMFLLMWGWKNDPLPWENKED